MTCRQCDTKQGDCERLHRKQIPGLWSTANTAMRYCDTPAGVQGLSWVSGKGGRKQADGKRVVIETRGKGGSFESPTPVYRHAGRGLLPSSACCDVVVLLSALGSGFPMLCDTSIPGIRSSTLPVGPLILNFEYSNTCTVPLSVPVWAVGPPLIHVSNRSCYQRGSKRYRTGTS